MRGGDIEAEPNIKLILACGCSQAEAASSRRFLCGANKEIAYVAIVSWLAVSLLLRTLQSFHGVPFPFAQVPFVCVVVQAVVVGVDILDGLCVQWHPSFGN